MSLMDLDNKRQLLFSAVNDAKSVVGTDDFINKVDIVSDRGFDFAVQAGVVSKDEALQIEELFSTTILTKGQVISDLRRIFGSSRFTFGPGSKILIGGDMVNGYFGEVSASELFTGGELASLLNVTQGSVINNGTSWLKFARYGNVIYIPKRPIRHSISWNNLNTQNLIYGNNPDFIVEKDSHLFVTRLMTVGISDPSPLEGEGSEWNELMHKVHEQFGDWEQFTSNDLVISGANDGPNGNITIGQETVNNENNRFVTKGYHGITHFQNALKSGTRSNRGWRPVIALKQRDGSYSTGREHYSE